MINGCRSILVEKPTTQNYHYLAYLQQKRRLSRDDINIPQKTTLATAKLRQKKAI